MRAAVLGSPVAHSLSPVLHTAAYAAMGLDDWSYGRYECDEEELAPFLKELDETWAGLSLTMPLKRRALDLADRVGDLARRVGGANTLIPVDGGWHAHNTDVEGVATALAEAGIGAPREAVILGAGATAASALAALLRLGLTSAVTVLARDTSRTGEVTAAAERLGHPVRVAPLTEIGAHLDVDLVVSSLPSGAADRHADLLAASRADLFDVVYSP
ncbi:shikimate dehydrogenase, partial [Nocardiopsis lucentensis]|uniref:shikimate dehydrogenase n=1 Tax=Nocardiopsis lucentensis TaxID=53441 RepID=UPI0003778917